MEEESTLGQKIEFVDAEDVHWRHEASLFDQSIMLQTCSAACSVVPVVVERKPVSAYADTLNSFPRSPLTA